MKVFVCASKHCYKYLPEIIPQLEKLGHEITLPNSYDDPMQEERAKSDPEKHTAFKDQMFRLQIKKVENSDAILVVNEKKYDSENYIGGSVLLEIYEAWKQNKKIFLYNPIPNNMLKDEIEGFNPIIINKDLAKIR